MSATPKTREEWDAEDAYYAAQSRWAVRVVKIVLSALVIVGGLGQCLMLPPWVGIVGAAGGLWFIWSE